MSFENRDKLKIFENLTKIDNNSPFIIISDPDFDLINKYEITEFPSLFCLPLTEKKGYHTEG